MKKIFSSLLPVALLIATSSLFAQQVTVMVSINPPYSPYLSTYADQPNKVLITIINNTPIEQELKLWVKISGDNGVSVTTRSDFNPSQAITVGGNQSAFVSFDGPSTKDYFDANNVDLVGITKLQLIQNQALPEGNYTICVRALGYSQPYAPKSEEDCKNFPVNYIDPPLAMQPLCGNTLTPTNPQFVLFSWTPPATAQGLVNYEFTLKEVPNNLNPNDVIKNNAFPVVYNTTQSVNTTLAYTVALPQLEDEKKYVWRVKAIDPNNSVQFKNGGYSEACWFSFAESKKNFAKPVQLQGDETTNQLALKILLVSPKNETEIEWTNATSNEYGHYEFYWQNLSANYSYHTSLVKMKPGQTKEDAIMKNPDMNQTDKSEPISAPYKYFPKLETGVTYAWQVSTAGDDYSKQIHSEVWTFNVAPPDTGDMSSFIICGYKVHITNLDNKDIDKLGGTGYLYLWEGGPKIDVSFSNLEVRHCGLKSGKKIDWRVSKGIISDELKNLKPYPLKPKDGLEGDFELVMKSFAISSNLNANFDQTKGWR